jgi:hypothetical protein
MMHNYRTFPKQPTADGGNRGDVMIDQFRPTDIDLFWADWKLGARAKGKPPPHAPGVLPFSVNRK